MPVRYDLCSSTQHCPFVLESPEATLSNETTRESPVQETVSQPEAMPATGLREADRARMTLLETPADEMDISTYDYTTVKTPA